MGLKEAKEYIDKLHKLQEDPFKWPDYLTGLPDRAAVLRRLGEIYPKLGKYAVSFVRISNVHSYILKYGASRHADVIQWAAAILKTTAADYRDAFVGAVGTHEFLVISRADHAEELLKKAKSLFQKKTRPFYSAEDLAQDCLISFSRDGKKVCIGFMDLLSATIDTGLGISKNAVIQYLAEKCSEQEQMIRT